MSMRYKGSRLSATANTPTSLTASGAWTLQQQMQANGTSTWPFVRDPQFNYVTMLLHGDGSAGANNGSGGGVTPTVTNFNADASTNNFNVTINGDARSNNFTPYQAGYYSNYFDGTSGQYLNAPANTVFNFGTGDFTVEAWVYPTSTSGTRPIIEVRTTGGANGFALLSQSGATTLNVFTNSAFVGASTNSLTLNAWNHVALTRSTNTWTYWINGVSGGSFTNSSTQSDGGTTGPKIGGSTTSGEIWIGFISNARITKGAALYSTTFTPSTTPLTTTVSSGTVSLLTSQSNRFIDNSVNAFTITVNGSPQVAPAQPFTLPSSVATYGSGYFDGTGDYLTTPMSTPLTLGAGDFTIECWLYSAFSGEQRPLSCLESTLNYYIYAIYLSGTELRFYAGDGTSYAIQMTASGVMKPNAWNHVAVVRSGSTATMYLNGVSVATDASATVTLPAAGTPLWLGGEAYGGGYNFFNGYMTDARIVKGTAVYTTTFTPPTAPLTAITNTSLLTTQFNGAGNNSGFKDSSQNNFVIRRNGNTTQGTFAPYGSNWSANFAASSTTYLSAASNAAFAFGTGDFTMEAFVFATASQTDNWIIGLENNCWFRVSSGGALQFFNSVTSTGTLASTALPLNTWTHVAVVRSGTALTIYQNGVSVGTATVSTNFSSSVACTIGNQVGFDRRWNGYISNARVVKGTAVYTAAFTPSTTPLTAISGTSLLTCADNRFIDDSTNNFTLTVSGSPSVQRFSPFANATAYNPAVTGGSGFFNGNGGTYLTAPSTSGQLGSGDFTIECWSYLISRVSNFPCIWSNYSVFTTGTLAIFAGHNSASTNKYQIALNGTFPAFESTASIIYNQWTHIALVRSGSTITLYLNGVANGTVSSSATLNGTSGISYIGSTGDDLAGSYLNGYLSNLRVVRGTAVYTSAFTPPPVPLTPTPSTQLLLSNTNAGILDQSMMNDLQTVGNAAVSTSVVKYGTASMYFDGTGDYLDSGGSAVNFAFGTGDFTIEFWMYLNSTTQGHPIDFRPSSVNGAYPTLYITSNTLIYFTNSANQITSNSLSTSTWYHVAISRSGTNTKMFINGTQNGSTYTDSTNYLCKTNGPRIGANDGGTGGVNGYIDDLRITKGYARYTTTFTPPTQALPNG